MGPKSKAKSVKSLPPWDPSQKENWHLELEEEELCDDRWTCAVVAAVEAHVSEVECVAVFNKVAESKLRKEIRTITMTDVVKLLKGANQKKGRKEKGPNKPKSSTKGERPLAPLPPKFEKIVQLAEKYSTFSEGECKLPPDLMACLLKYMLITMKTEDYFQRQVENARTKKKKESELKMKFIEEKTSNKQDQKLKVEKKLCKEEPILDAFYNGPEIYVLLSGFYNILYFTEMLKVNIPLLGLIRVEGFQMTAPENKPNSPKSKKSEKGIDAKKEALIENFWFNFREEVGNYESTSKFKDITMLKYKVSDYSCIYDDLSKLQYEVETLRRQHKSYLNHVMIQHVQELHEPLLLEKCKVYTKGADAVHMAAGPEFLLLYFMIEQVIAGVPACPEINHDDLDGELMEMTLNKSLRVPDNTPEDSERQSTLKDFETQASQWKTPITVSYGDSLTLETFDMKRDIINVPITIKRFLSKSAIPSIWSKFRKLSQSERAYYDFHFYRLRKFTVDTEDVFKFKINLSVIMKLILLSKMLRKDVKDTVDEASENVSDLNPQYSDLLNDVFQRYPKPKSLYDRRPTTTDSTSIQSKNNFECVEDDTKNVKEYDLKQLRTMLECPEISNIPETCSMGQTEDSELSMKEFNFYEKLKPQMMTQALRNAHNSFNAVLYEYYPPTDTLLLMFYNDYDYNGMYTETSYSCLTTPVGLRDFVRFVYKEEIDWVSQEEKNNINFLRNLQSENELDSQIKEKEYWDKLTRDFELMNEQEKDAFLEIVKEDPKSTKGNKENKNKMKSVVKDDEIKLKDLEDLPVKKCQEKQGDPIFITHDISEIREQINTKTQQYFSKDGTKIYLNLTSWVFSNREKLSLEIKRRNISLYVHRWLKDPISKYFHVRTESGVLLAFSEPDSLKQSESVSKVEGTKDKKPKKKKGQSEEEIIKSEVFQSPSFFYNMKASLPSGLILETKKQPDSNLYVKQSYTSNEGPGEGNKETSRCFLRNGHILIFREGGNVDILGTDGSKVNCYGFHRPPPVTSPFPTQDNSIRKPKSKERSSKEIRGKKGTKQMETKARDPLHVVPSLEVKPQVTLEVYDYDIITPNGEFWARASREKCSKEKRLIENMKVLTGRDSSTGEVFWRRGDGTNTMLWSDGSLVVTYPDGTKITTVPEYDEEVIDVEWTDEEKYYYLALEAEFRPLGSSIPEQHSLLSTHSGVRNKYPSSVTFGSISCSPSKVYRTSSLPLFDPNNIECFHVETFVSVKRSIMYEHPKYATVYYPALNRIEVRMPTEIQIEVAENGLYKVHFENDVELEVKENSIDFISICKSCKEVSVSNLNFTQDTSDVFCTTLDLFGKLSTILENGEMVVEDFSKTKSDLGNYVLNNISQRTIGTRGSVASEEETKCSHPQENIGPKERYFILNKDLSGVELLQDEDLATFISKQPDQSFTNMNIVSEDGTEKFHRFYTPVFQRTNEKWIMDYSFNNSIPTNIKRKDLRSKEVNKIRLPFPKKCLRNIKSDTTIQSNHNFDSFVPPKALIIRTIYNISPSVQENLRAISKVVQEYREKADVIIDAYQNHTAQDKRSWEEKNIEMRLKRIAMTLNQSLKYYPHYMIQTPSTEKDICGISHNLHLNDFISKESAIIDGVKINLHMDQFILPKCNQIPTPLAHLGRDLQIEERESK